jgi:hypothetical protein
MRKLIWLVLIVAATSTAALAQSKGGSVPEIDANSGVAAVSLLAGAVLVIRSRRKKLRD